MVEVKYVCCLKSSQFRLGFHIVQGFFILISCIVETEVRAAKPFSRLKRIPAD